MDVPRALEILLPPPIIGLLKFLHRDTLLLNCLLTTQLYERISKKLSFTYLCLRTGRKMS